MVRQTKNVFFFTDISESVGTGHFWRSARLAHALGQRYPDARVTMMLPDDVVSRRSVEKFSGAHKNPHVTFLFNDHAALTHSRRHDIFKPLPVGFTACFPVERDVTIVDSYRLCGDALRDLKAQGIVGVVDDFGHIPDLGGAHVDFVINANHFGATYTNDAHLKVLASPEYHFLSQDLFVERPRNPDVVVVTFGGTDKGHLGLRLLEKMWKEDAATIERFDFKVVVPCPETEQTYRAPDLVAALNSRLEIVRHYDPSDFFWRAGQIICAGGQTVPEAQAAGTRFVGIASLNQTQTAVRDWAGGQQIETADCEGLAGQALELELERFAKACLKVLRQGCAVQLPRQNPNGFNRLVDDVWFYANRSAPMPRSFPSFHATPKG